MTRTLSLFAALAILAVALAVPGSGKGQELDYEMSIRVVGRIMEHSTTESGSKGVPNKFEVDLNDDLNLDLTIWRQGAAAVGTDLAEEGVVFEALVRPVEGEQDHYLLVRWLRFGLL